MFTFNGGDLIILGIVLIVLFVYRQLDRNNRSLERVKKFADQAEQQLGQITEQQTVQLKDIAIEVDVHQQAVKAVFQRLQEAEKEFAQRVDLIDSIKSRIDGYDQAIESLVAKTELAQTNLQRVKEESRFIDGLGKRIREASSQLGEIEKRIPTIVDEFTKKNSATFQDSGNKLLTALAQKASDSEDRVNDVQNNLHQTIQEIRQEMQNVQLDMAKQVKGYQDDFLVIEAEHKNHLKEVAEEAEKLELSVFESLKTSIHQHGQEIESWQGSLRERIDVFTTEFEENYTGFRDDLFKAMDETNQQTQNRIELLTQDIDEKLQTEGDRLSGIEEEADSRAEAMRQIFQTRDEQLKSELDQVYRRAVEQTDSVLSRLSQELSEKSGMLEEHLGKELESIRSQADESNQQLELLGQQLIDHAAAQKNQLVIVDQEGHNRAEEIRKIFYQVEERLKAELEEIRQKGSQLADQTFTRMSQDIETKSESLQESISQRLDDITLRADQSHSQIDRKFSDLQGRLDSWIADTESFISGLEVRMTEVDHQVALTQEEYEQRVSAYLEKTKLELQNSEEFLRDQLEALSNQMSRVQSDSHSELEELKQSLIDKTDRVSEQISLRIQTAQDEQLSELGTVVQMKPKN
jgi:DNA repair exonuclease SbcCD ATPase subunit